jgi:Tfp pilus assembly protein PilF
LGPRAFNFLMYSLLGMRHSAKCTERQGRRTVARLASRTENDRLVTGIISVVLAAIVWVVFSQTLGHGFVNYDDGDYVYNNPVIISGLTLRGIQWAFTHAHAANWHPLTTISHMLDCQLYGLQPGGHHLTNVLLHGAAAVLLFLALQQLTGTRWPSAFVAAVFAIHPLRVESVAWISERKDVLSGVFFMLVLWTYAHYVRADQRHSRQSRRWYIAAILFFALGLMCKPTLVTLPFVLLLLDYWPLRRFAPNAGKHNDLARWRQLTIEKIPFFVLSVASCVTTVLAQQEAEAVVPVNELSMVDRFGNAATSYVIYITQMIWPARLAAVYPEVNLNTAQAGLAFLVLLLLSVTFFMWRRNYPFLLIGWLWFLGMLVPMIGIIQVGPQARADRYTYLPLIGLYLLATWGTMALVSNWGRRRELLIGAAVSIITGLIAISYFQTSTWRNSETMWHQTLAHTSRNQIAENSLGKALVKERRLDEAAAHFQKALDIYPDYAEANANLADVLCLQGQWRDAVDHYQMALRSQPKYAMAHNNLGIALAVIGNTDEAIDQFREALRINANYADAHANLARCLVQIGRREDAVGELTQALRLRPDDARVKERLRELGVGK